MRKGWIIALLLVAVLTPAAADRSITLTFGGDCVLGTREEWVGQPDTFDACVDAKGTDWCFSGIQDWLTGDDMTLVNLECVLQNGNEGHNNKKQHTFRGKPEYAQLLLASGVEAVNLANNHSIDYGQSGETSTREALDSAGVLYCGYDDLFILVQNNIKIGFGGCRETVFYEENKATVYREIQKLKAMGCTAVVYCCHWGEEYSPAHNKRQVYMAQYAANSGADIVVGTHPHVVQGVANLDGCAVLYSLGNLVFGGTHELQTFDAMLARATLRFADDGSYLGAEIRLVPVLTSGAAPQNDFRPVPAAGEDAERILNLVQADSDMEIGETLWFPAQ